MSERALVTGATGLVGSAVAAALQESGFDVIGLGSADGDLRDAAVADGLLSRHRPDVVVHLAARVHGIGGNAHAQGEMFFDNARINLNVVDASRRHGVRKVVAMGSVAMYSDDVELPMREADVWRGAPHRSEAGYAHAKRGLLAQLEAYQAQYGMSYAVALCTNLFGPGDRFDEVGGHVLPSLISKFYRGVHDGDQVVAWGTGIATRDFLHSRDAARAMVRLVEAGDGVYNVASGVPISIRELVGHLIEVSGYTGTVEWDVSKPDGQAERAYDITRLASLGWAPSLAFRDGLADVWAWYGSHIQSVRR